MRVLVAMSGGVDSAVAAARLVAEGHDVTGVHLALSKNPASYRSGARGCCSLEDSHDARRVADKLDIPFYVWDFAEEFHEAVVEDFIAEYQAGRTPNPCLRCNEKIKFAAVLDRGVALGFDAVATGHYADLQRHDDGSVSLHRAADAAKDQSYVLGMLNQEQLSRCLFPLHDVEKPVVRQEAAALGFGVAKKPDSHDICFIADGDTQGFLSRYLDDRPGPIIDADGQVLGEHQGHHRYTVGQRKGLDLRVPAPTGEPRYVLSIEPVSNTVVVGAREDLAVRSLRGIRPTWTESPIEGRWRGHAQYRAHGIPQDATISLLDGDLVVALDEPASGVAPGQTVVVYDGSRVVGSAVIAEAR
ncbi:tRNA 2-thiouridine(34) synthase MnmA [Tessaracoccus sp. ZS01]|uniref:tRNA 2-thiouridine(34) synthase MnmA n=1 Tax=Tessaracoccus sp. ZS01 TaxID=1906324 RepID=UPI00096FD7CA|nr:tRNA 2-thiouridine(34) synthase MnmA [Tessaracoccus sp. ZS01]MCG6566350.1 tRNA 2-thiouridine(34) synthase MnmA [Tessaracoccus sp. ZS01]OMG58818.1 tRNA 2-thiouridine(34) synthase MnmA [Tessaracoccus sp. ZS01]